MRAESEYLAQLGAADSVVAELAAYNTNTFDREVLGGAIELPLEDEPFAATWRGYAAARPSAFETLSRRLPQLAFPIRRGISGTEDYIAATRRGTPVELLAGASPVELERPDQLELTIHRSLAGSIALLISRHRADFVTLARAIGMKNEPETVLEAQGAWMISGYNNWDRIAQHKRAWESLPPEGRETASWEEEFQRIAARKELYQDRFILLSDGPYSAVRAADLGLSEARWRELSLGIRREHECCHYLTRRLLGSMRNNVLDELMADYAGLATVAGRFHSAWFLRFLGLEAFPSFREAGRLSAYRGDPPLSDEAFALLRELVWRAAENAERFDREQWPAGRTRRDVAIAILAFASLGLVAIAAADGAARLARARADLECRTSWRDGGETP